MSETAAVVAIEEEHHAQQQVVQVQEQQQMLKKGVDELVLHQVLEDVDDVRGTIEVLVDAFTTDPIYLFIFEHSTIVEGLKFLYPRILDISKQENANIRVVKDDDGTIIGVNVWSPPGGDAVSYWQLAQQGILKFPFLFGITATKRLIELLGILESWKADYKSYWYLDQLAVITHKQGKGLGSKMLAKTLKEVDDMGVSSMLVTSKEENVRLYQRFGYVLLKQHFVTPETSFKLMIREHPSKSASSSASASSTPAQSL